MEFVTSAILGGLLYDFVKMGTLSLSEYMKTSIKGYLFSNEELELLSSIVDETKKEDSFSKEVLTVALDKHSEILPLLKKINDSSIVVQINNIETNNGAVFADNNGTLNFNFNK